MRLARRFRLVSLLILVAMLAGCPAGEDAVIETIIPANAEAGRWIVLPGANNTRDIGGYATRDGRTVRRGMVYRSGALSRLTDEGCHGFRELGIRRVIDFRNRFAPSPLFDGDVPCVFEASSMSLLPVLSEPTDVPEQRYVQTVAKYAHSYRQAFTLLAEPNNLPLLFHCAAGKDRSGIMAALLLTLLGVERDMVIADYELSDLVAAPVSTGCLIELLDEVERQGGIEAYLRSIGVPTETQERIRGLLLE
ncbi:MAG TPA: tyrosine-protein phosphatase [Phycisphaerae bacterium]|nr:tyrosine-protein phosphatase [Phycisphaerae bacterium]HON65528.1 tyrosine-protein phosphatase [Phycisphaerae bacterium]HOQ86127.1 tyrosine-protein phosphatase [Phycisphaerae bacterium]HPU26693.1 tyrosine-protein phosphatase [Phycisphaerae bacterium]HQE30077.1 tyrosine-protein phosphatase [Phycisphaerae bacterium]